jgi:hypothetical protein
MFDKPPEGAKSPDVQQALKKKKKKKDHRRARLQGLLQLPGPLQGPTARVLAINRGEGPAIRVKIDADVDAMYGRRNNAGA